MVQLLTIRRSETAGPSRHSRDPTEEKREDLVTEEEFTYANAIIIIIVIILLHICLLTGLANNYIN